MTEDYATKATKEVRRFEYLASDISGAPLVFHRTARDVLWSECGRYQVERMDFGGDVPELRYAFDANYVERGVTTCIAFEGTVGDAKRACELHAGRLQRALPQAA